MDLSGDVSLQRHDLIVSERVRSSRESEGRVYLWLLQAILWGLSYGLELAGQYRGLHLHIIPRSRSSIRQRVVVPSSLVGRQMDDSEWSRISQGRIAISYHQDDVEILSHLSSRDPKIRYSRAHPGQGEIPWKISTICTASSHSQDRLSLLRRGHSSEVRSIPRNLKNQGQEWLLLEQ